ncbi:MAG: GNAT family N-acetyltransferase [Lentisphaeria bacterium]|nr:GNAT family N-acetyltransferase [Lentisphaeria bacterium]
MTHHFTEITNPDDLQIVRDIAASIWPETFRSILSQEQITYMMNMMYAPEVMEKEFHNGYHFLLRYVDDAPAGYMVWSPWEEAPQTTAKLHKLYLLSKYHRQGYGHAMLDHVADQCRKHGFQDLILAVNKQNTRAYHTYLKNGYTTFRSVKIDIGNGFFMDDYWMKRPLL